MPEPADSGGAPLDDARRRTAASCELSVVVGSIDSSRSIARCLAGIERACAGIDAEILIVDASTDDTVERVRAVRPDLSVRRLPPGTLTPVLWAAGLGASRGRVVAFTTGHCAVGDDWARALLGGIDRGATGVAGALALSRDSSALDSAIFYLRYSAFQGAGQVETRAHEIPGDNAAYRRDALDRHRDSFANGFWEVDFHRRIRADGAWLSFVPGAEVAFGPSAPFRSLARQRYLHGCHSGSWRVKQGMRPAWQVVVGAPLVPLVLAVRIGRRVFRRSGEAGRFMRALPALLALSAAWAAGEAWGAMGHSTDTSQRFRA
jgi:glycosyltransferase involved in cell wall biosynthesis